MPEKVIPQEFRISRLFNVPRELLWKVWTEPEHLMKWLQPQGAAMEVCTMDFRTGGIFHYCMKSPDGTEMWGKWVFREITPPKRLVLVNSFSDSEGGVTRHPFSPHWPLKLLTTSTLEDRNGKTELTLTWLPFDATGEEIETFNASHESMNMGWGGTFAQLDSYVQALEGE